MMVDEQQRDALATTLLERNLVKTRDEALELAAKFLEMDNAAEPVAIAGDTLESAPAAEQAYASVLYYEQLKLEPTGASPFANARIETRSEPARPIEPAPQQAPREQPVVDLTQMFNAAKMRKAQES